MVLGSTIALVTMRTQYVAVATTSAARGAFFAHRAKIAMIATNTKLPINTADFAAWDFEMAYMTTPERRNNAESVQIVLAAWFTFFWCA